MWIPAHINSIEAISIYQLTWNTIWTCSCYKIHEFCNNYFWKLKITIFNGKSTVTLSINSFSVLTWYQLGGELLMPYVYMNWRMSFCCSYNILFYCHQQLHISYAYSDIRRQYCKTITLLMLNIWKTSYNINSIQIQLQPQFQFLVTKPSVILAVKKLNWLCI